MATNTERKIVSVENALITDVVTAAVYENGSERRVEIHTNKQFEKYNKKNELATTNKFSKDFSKVVEAINHPLMKLIRIKAVGRVITPQTLSLFLFGAEISFDNVYYEKGEKREERIFERNEIVAEIKDITLHLDEVCENEIRRMITTDEVYLDPKKKQQNVNVNFYNV